MKPHIIKKIVHMYDYRIVKQVLRDKTNKYLVQKKNKKCDSEADWLTIRVDDNEDNANHFLNGIKDKEIITEEVIREV